MEDAGRMGEFKSAAARTAVPAAEPPRAAWWLPGPHLTTIFGKMFRRVDLPPTTREHWAMADGDTMSVEWLRGKPDAPTVVIFHGLEGGFHSSYARGLMGTAFARGWSSALVLWRTCDGNEVNAVARSYHSGASDDAAFAIGRALEVTRGPVCLVGVSLGGNVLLKWLGERGHSVDARVVAAAAVSVPYDLALASEKLERGFSAVYTRFFLKSLRRKALAKCAHYPDRFNAARIAGSKTLQEFDDAVTGPLHGFDSAAHYYEQCSSIHFLANIRVPTLLLNARNDPFLPRVVLTKVEAIAEANSALRCVFPEHGGHVGFIGGGLFRPNYWMEDYCLDWLGRAVTQHHSITISSADGHV